MKKSESGFDTVDRAKDIDRLSYYSGLLCSFQLCYLNKWLHVVFRDCTSILNLELPENDDRHHSTDTFINFYGSNTVELKILISLVGERKKCFKCSKRTLLPYKIKVP